VAKKRFRPIVIPKDIKISIAHDKIKVQGPLGNLETSICPRVRIEIRDNQVFSINIDNTKEAAAQQGTMRTLITNMMDGVQKGFSKTLVIQGTGYRAQLGAGGVQLFLGYSKPVTINLPKGVTAELSTVKSADKGDLTYITIKGIDKQLIGDLAATIHGTRVPDPYKHKGVRYADEVLRKKVGKRAVVQA
jgi:large subunit ribosomal protein L6